MVFAFAWNHSQRISCRYLDICHDFPMHIGKSISFLCGRWENWTFLHWNFWFMNAFPFDTKICFNLANEYFALSMSCVFFLSRHSRSNNILSKLLLLKDANKSQHIWKVYSFPCIDVTIRMRIVIAVVNFGDDIDEKDNEPLALSRSLLHYHSFTYSISHHVGCFNCMEVLENYIDSTRHSLEDFQFSVSYSLDGILCMHLITIYHACSFTPTMTITTFTKPSNSGSNNNTEEQKANNKFEMLMLKNIHIIWQSFRIT